MNLIIVHRNKDSANSGGKNFLRFALTSNPIASIVMDSCFKYSNKQKEEVSLFRFLGKRCVTETLYAVPQEWSVPIGNSEYKDSIVFYNSHIPIPSRFIENASQKESRNKWLVISNGRFLTKINENLLYQVLDKTNADVVSINAEPGLLGEREKVRLTAQGKIAGFRRLYCDSAKLCPVPDDWPAHLFVKQDVFKKLLTDSLLPVSFLEMMEKCKANAISVCAVDAGGIVLDLEKEEDMLQLSRLMLLKKNNTSFSNGNSVTIADDSRLTGKIIFGNNIQIGSKSVIIGPAVIGDNVVIEEGSVICSSIIGSNIRIQRDKIIHNKIINEQDEQNISGKNSYFIKSNCSNLLQDVDNRFRRWPIFSYASLFKRIADILTAIFVLTLFVPLIPFIAAAIKLTSPGTIFYRDKRQGLHGKEFHCLKFRTMIAGASKIQEKLRFVNQVDGPQFKMNDDPRISIVGRFLRETYIDEIPQFFNVLLGHMSVVGPRPSPESENTLCPSWRDARLSVRPGITGLWQIYGTRRPMKDFQEWIYYDTEYVKNLSLKTDLIICWRTAKKLIDTFIRQF